MTHKKCSTSCACRAEATTRELDRLDKLERALWPKAEAGEEESLSRLLDIVDRRCRLLDLYAPRKVALLYMDGTKPFVFPKGKREWPVSMEERAALAAAGRALRAATHAKRMRQIADAAKKKGRA